KHGRDSGVCRVFDVTAGVDGVRVVGINQDGNRRTDSQTLELSRVFGVFPGPETTVETQRKSTANAVIDADSRRASHQVRRRWNPTCPKRRIDARETVVAIPGKKGAVGDEEQAHENRQCGVEANAPKRAPSVRAIHLSIDHRGPAPSACSGVIPNTGTGETLVRLRRRSVEPKCVRLKGAV